MSTIEPQIKKPAALGEPVWEIANLFPCQGYWSEEEYLALETNDLIEFTDGSLEFLPMPTHPPTNSFYFTSSSSCQALLTSESWDTFS